MVNQDVVFEKIKQIQNCLKRIHAKTKNGPQSLDDMDVQDIFVLNLQRAVQRTIDLAAHVIADEGLGLPSELKENFKLLEEHKIISAMLSQKLQHMVGFRNIAVHDYSAIDPEILKSILKSILKNNLKDLEEFYSILLKHLHLDQ